MFNFLFVVSIAITSLSAIDSILTRTAIEKGYEEKCSVTRNLIEKYGLDKAMIIRFLPAPAICGIIISFSLLFGLINVGVIWGASIALVLVLIFCSYVVAHDCIELWKGHV